MSKSRSLNRFAVALALAAVLAGARFGVQMFAAPTATFDTLPDLKFNQGQAITIAFAAQGFPADLTYTIEGLPALPPGLSMSPGIDTLGHVVGILSGTLPADTPAASGSEGEYTVRVRASDGAVSNSFTIDVSHWNHGDVFVGGGEWIYQVYREDGTFKTNVQVPDDASMTFGGTTGCAVNWRTGEVWTTNFDDVFPALNVITRHAGSNPLPYTDPSRRLSTLRYGPGDSLTPYGVYNTPFDISPESVAFNNAGDMLVGHSFGYFNDNGDIADANGNPIVLEDPTDGWVYVDGSGQPIRDALGHTFAFAEKTSPAGFFERWITGAPPFNVLGTNGLPITVPLQGGMDMHRYTPDANGNYNTADRQIFDFHYGVTGIDTLDLLSDQKTMNYSSEDWYIYRYDISADKQMPVLGSNVLGESKPISTRAIYGIRALPPGDGTGGYLAVNESHIDRLDQNGHIVQTYDIHGDNDYDGGDANGWFAIAIAPGGREFWAATRQDVFHFDIASGEVIGTKIHATVGTLHTNAELAGLCVMDEYRAAQEVCGPTGLGNGIDDDFDGTIDEGCFRVETCSAFSPGDDDGDGLIDYNDPDCGAPPAQQCVTNGPTDNSVAGVCDRADYEGDTVVVPGIPLPCVFCDEWTFSYSAVGLPNGLTMDPSTGAVTGTPFYSIVNPNSETSAPVVFPVTVNSTWQRVGAPAASFTKTFNWTIFNRNRAPVAVDDGVQTVNAGGNFTFDVRFNDSDIDGDNPLTIVSFTQPPVGQGSVAQAGQNLVYTAPLGGFSGLTSFTYIIKDTYNPAGESNVATVRVRVNNLPLAANDSYVTLKNTPLIASVAGNDTPSIDGGNVWTVTSGPASGVVVMLPGGGFTYTPALNFTGTVTFNYKVCDVDNDCANAIATIKINDVPLAVNDSFTTPLNTALNATVTGNDTPSADGGNVWTKLTNPLHGGVTMTAAGGFTYTPNTNYAGLDSFTYKVCDVDNDCSTATVTIKINDVPKAVNDSYTTPKNTPLTGSVTSNDTPSLDIPNVWTVTTPPTSGLLVFLPTGGFTYTPALNFTGTVTFNYKVCDIDNDCANAVATIKINDVPLAVNDSFTTPVNTAVNATVTGNDTPSADGGNTWTKVTDPSHGTVTVTAAGGFTYTPNTNYTGSDSFTYKVCDIDNDCSTATVTIRINDVPKAVNDSYTTPKNTALVASVTGNDTPSLDAPNVWAVTTPPTSGLLVFLPTGGFTYTPALNFTGTVTFNYKVCDVDNDCANAVATIKINDVPVAVNDSFTTPKNTALTASVTGNDTSSADGGNTWTRVTNPLHGAVTVTAAGGFTYTPNTNYTGTDSFTYKVCDVDNDCSTATVTIKINDVPVAVNDNYTTSKNTLLTSSVAGNDTSSLDAPNVWTVTTPPTSGLLVFLPTGGFTYTPALNFTGTVTFTYKVCDVDNDCATAIATIKISDVPLAVNDSFTTPKNTALTASVTGNDTPSADGGNTWARVTSPSNGTVTVTAAGGFTYTPNTNFTGTDSFTYKICDVDNDCSTATVTIKINDVPLAVNDSFTTTKNTPVSGTVTGNDTPSADGGNTWTVVTPPTSGTVVLNPNGTFTYTPATGFSGTVTFSYKVCDVDNDCANAIVTIRINDRPVAVNDVFTTTEDTPVSSTLTGNDTPSADGGNVWTKTSNPANGTAAVNPDGTFTYTPNANFSGTDTFTYKVCDADGDCSTATVTITITGVDDAPLALDDTYSTLEDTPITGSVVGNDTLSGDGGNVWSVVTGVSHGTLTFNTNGTFTYTPAANYNGIDSFFYKICDADGDCSTATAIITITPTNDVPVALNDVYTMAPNTSITKDASVNDTASGDGGNVWTKLTNPASGTVVFNANGTFTYTAAVGFSGVVSFNYKLCDANNDCSNATVTITIAAVTTGSVGTGDTATIGYWQNQNGQALIKKMNGSATATNLGTWLATSFPSMWGATAGTSNNMTGKTNTQVAAYYITVFKSDKWMAQVLAGAIASYVTSSTLSGGNYSVPYGFNYSLTGTGTKTWNTGSQGTNIGLANNTSYTVSALLAQANLRKQLGTYNSNAFNVIFSGINEKGDIK